MTSATDTKTMHATEIEPHPKGAVRNFDYLFAGSDMLAEYNSHHGQAATVIRPLVEGEEYDGEGDKMYRVIFEDGFEADVWHFELIEIGA